jgi:HPt (histidine-containing phosphotransfer) domain-containing protein
VTGSHADVEREMTPVEVGGHRYRDVEHESSTPPLDDSPGTLADDVGPEVYAEILSSFLSHLQFQRIELGVACADCDVAAAQLVAHQIKGTALSFGAVRLDELAERLLQIEGDDHALLRSLVSEMDEAVCSFQSAANISVGDK